MSKEITETTGDEKEARKGDCIRVQDPEDLWDGEGEVLCDGEDGDGDGGAVDDVKELSEGYDVEKGGTKLLAQFIKALEQKQ
ncbi:hypothetical protein BGZ47_001151 [Haplosporangium gracile]|nr:hypothetical protein BGZ47_001151 [Haplosporangium gracile]